MRLWFPNWTRFSSNTVQLSGNPVQISSAWIGKPYDFQRPAMVVPSVHTPYPNSIDLSRHSPDWRIGGHFWAIFRSVEARCKEIPLVTDETVQNLGGAMPAAGGCGAG